MPVHVKLGADQDVSRFYLRISTLKCRRVPAGLSVMAVRLAVRWAVAHSTFKTPPPMQGPVATTSSGGRPGPGRGGSARRHGLGAHPAAPDHRILATIARCAGESVEVGDPI